MFLYQNLTNFVEFDNKVNQLWFSDLDEDRFSGQENLTNWIYERSESFKTIFRCEWAVVASEFEFKNLPKFRQLFLLRLRDENTGLGEKLTFLIQEGEKRENQVLCYFSFVIWKGVGGDNFHSKNFMK